MGVASGEQNEASLFGLWVWVMMSWLGVEGHDVFFLKEPPAVFCLREQGNLLKGIVIWLVAAQSVVQSPVKAFDRNFSNTFSLFQLLQIT
jgi:hypothetical protein